MKLEVYEKFCRLQQFIDRLDKVDNLHLLFSDLSLKSVTPSQKGIIDKVYSMLHRNYSILASYPSDIKPDCCRYLNYWLDAQKEKHVTVKKDIDSNLWYIIEKLWDDLERANIPPHCERKPYEKSSEKTKKKMDLMVYCVKRDFLKNRCKLTINNSYQHFCTVLPQYIEKYYSKFSTENECINNKNDGGDYEFHYSNNCSLYDISNTFPDYRIEGGTISEIPSSRNPFPYCESTQKVTRNFKERSEQDPVPLLVEPPSSSPAFWNSVIYTGLTFFAIFFSFIFLYKHTFLGSLLRSFIMKKAKINRYNDEQGEKEFLEHSSNSIEDNSENSQYNFSYHSLQN
ncbi:PIR Superfamily Protein [Plasmodium ovale wallikeri]|uniref:PIR Superfamily Protein n=1 Tax=Plasmodium ovale wallikeri TaxID=864142 RepID=A0A1A8YJN5_PLAOA|nr:PIR Superfamily Protein [Plasmodium ovale wallikeri]SBT31546.1 PIR Superfamily Protein [Plasmodium ovale wallikeri]